MVYIKYPAVFVR